MFVFADYDIQVSRQTYDVITVCIVKPIHWSENFMVKWMFIILADFIGAYYHKLKMQLWKSLLLHLCSVDLLSFEKQPESFS